MRLNPQGLHAGCMGVPLSPPLHSPEQEGLDCDASRRAEIRPRPHRTYEEFISDDASLLAFMFRISPLFLLDVANR